VGEAVIRPVTAVLALLAAASLARADVTADSGFGFDGRAVPGAITPIRVDLQCTEKTPIRVRVSVAPGGGMGGVAGEGVVHSVDVYLAPGAKKRLTLPVVPRMNIGGDWRLVLEAERRTFLRHGTEFADGRRLSVSIGIPGSFQFTESTPPVVGVLGDPTHRVAWIGDANRFAAGPPRGKRTWSFNQHNGVGELRADGTTVILPEPVFVTPESAPDTWLGYEGFDAILWTDPDPDALKDAARVDALLEYAATGGRLVVALTPGSRIAADSPLGRALPADAAGHDDLPAGEVVAAFGGESRGGARETVPVARLGRITGRVAAALPDGRPLLVAKSHGLGTLVVASFDPRLLGAADPNAHARLLTGLFGSAVTGERTQGPGNAYWSASIEPLRNHLRKRFLSTPPLGLLALGLLLYVIAIGPADYFLLKRRGKLRRTVVTFPIIVVAFTGIAYGASFLLFGGNSGQARVAWLDFATAPGKDGDVVRGIDVLGAYSPIGTTLPMTYGEPRSFLAAPWIGSGSWMGGEEGSLDGTVAYGPDGRPEGRFELPLRAHRTVQARFSGEVPTSLDGTIRRAGGGRVVALRNGLRLPVRDLCVVADGRVRFLGDLAPGGAVEVDLGKDKGDPVGNDPRLPGPQVEGRGFFGGHDQWRGRFGRDGADLFVPRDGTDQAAAEARILMARASMGVSLGRLASEAPFQGQTRSLARQGLDLSRAVREGRVLVMGWCDGDPLGILPPGRNMKSSVVVVRRVLPAEEAK
jgi:hypothetical protein